MMEQIDELIEQEVNNRLESKLTKYLEYISKPYHISFSLLLKDMNKISEIKVSDESKKDQCMGVGSLGKRCKLKGKFGGYCRWHKKEERVKPPKPSYMCQPIVSHNHGIPPLFRADCPACQNNKTSEPELLIDM